MSDHEAAGAAAELGGLVGIARIGGASGRLGQVTQPDGKSYGYRYDYRMRRVGTRSTVSGTDTHTAILFSGGLSTAEYESSTLQTTLGNASAGLVHYVRGPDMGGGVGGLLYSLRTETGGGKKVRYNLSNGRGDIVAQSDINAALTWTASYEAYGKRTQETGVNADKQRANSKDEDPTGLLNEGFRYRDIETGIWLSRDPAGFVDGPNLYAYVMQNPWTGWDPLGLEVPKNREEARQKVNDINDTTDSLKKLSRVAIDKFGTDEGNQALVKSARLNQALGYMLAELSVYQDYADKDGNLNQAAFWRPSPLRGFDADTTAVRRFAGLSDGESVGLRDLTFDYGETAMAVGGARSLVSLIEAGGAKLLNKFAAKGSAEALEQPRNALGQFMSKTPGQTPPGFNAVDDFVAQAHTNGMEVLGREVSFSTPFGTRRYDLVLRNPATGATSGIEIKSSMGAMNRWDAATRKQFSADRWINMNGGAGAVGQHAGSISIDSTMKIMWSTP